MATCVVLNNDEEMKIFINHVKRIIPVATWGGDSIEEFPTSLNYPVAIAIGFEGRSPTELSHADPQFYMDSGKHLIDLATFLKMTETYFTYESKDQNKQISSVYCTCGGPSKTTGFGTLVIHICETCRKEKR